MEKENWKCNKKNKKFLSKAGEEKCKKNFNFRSSFCVALGEKFDKNCVMIFFIAPTLKGGNK